MFKRFDQKLSTPQELNVLIPASDPTVSQPLKSPLVDRRRKKQRANDEELAESLPADDEAQILTGEEELAAQSDLLAQASGGAVMTDAAPQTLAQASGAAVSSAGGASAGAGAVSATAAGGIGTLGAIGMVFGAVVVAAASDSDPTPTFEGTAVNSYVSGATVFIDRNGNGVLDAGEPSTTTDSQGRFRLPEGVTGDIVVQGGKMDGEEFKGVLKAPAGSTVVTPLTTLIAELVSEDVSVEDAEEIVATALGLNVNVSLRNLDPIAGVSSGSTGAEEIYKAHIKVATLVADLSNTIATTLGVESAGLTDLNKTVFQSLAAVLKDSDPASLDTLLTSDIGQSVLLVVDEISAQSTLAGVSLDPARIEQIQQIKGTARETIESFSNLLSNTPIEGVESITGLVDQKNDLLSDKTYTLQLLHFADAEAGLLASQTAPRLAALVDKFEDAFANSITLAGGDNFLPGPFLAAGTDPSLLSVLGVPGNRGNVEIAAVDIAIHNKIGVTASTIGNHEFDLGSTALAAAFRPGSGSPGAEFVYLSANLDFSGDSALNPHFVNTVTASGLEEASSLKGKIAPSAVITEGGARIGLVGATTQLLESISSPSGTKVKDNDSVRSDDMDLLASQLQPVIDDLIDQGVNKIILMSHLQNLANEKSLATKLSGVDIILAAGSNTRLGDTNDIAVNFAGHPADFADTYPLVIKDKDQNNTLVVNTDNEFTYLGRLVVDFDASGKIILDSLTSNTAINGAYAATDDNVAAAWGTNVEQLGTTAYAAGTRGGDVKAITDAVQSVINLKNGNVFGFSNVYLEGERIAVRNQETNLGNLSADANGYAGELALGQTAEQTYIVSLKNGGGIRAQIGTISPPKSDGTVDKLPPSGGSVSQLDVENSLRFDNKLMIFDTTPEQLKTILEHSVASLGNQGRFPQLGGVSFSFDPDATAGARISDIALIGDGYRVSLYDDGVKQVGAPSSISVVTLNFLAQGGDSYPIKANGENFRYLVLQSDGSYAVSAAVDELKNFTDSSVIAEFVTGTNVLLGEQAALEKYMRNFHNSEENAFDQPDTPAALDTRIQNLNERQEDIVEVTLLNASVDGLGDLVTLYFDRPLNNATPPELSRFEVKAGDAAQTIIGLQVVDNRVTLRLSQTLAPEASVKVSYTDKTAGDDTSLVVQSVVGADAASFVDVPVKSRLSLIGSGTENFAQASSVTLAGAEISAFDPGNNRLFVTSSSGLQVLSVDADLKLTLLGTVSLGSNDINSVAVKNGIVAVAVAASDKTQPGSVYFLDAGAVLSVSEGVIAHEGFVEGNVTVGALPDMLIFTADGTKVLVANEGEQDITGNNPEGSVSIIDLTSVLADNAPEGAQPIVTTASFTAFNSKLAELKAEGVRLFAGEAGFENITVAQDLEPEYIAISPDGKTAFVTLQENNAIAILDIATATFTDIVPLGLKSFLGLPFDGSDRDGASNATLTALSTKRPVFGLYMPDTIASFTGSDGKAYYLIANEGDDRDDFITPDETIRVSSNSYVLDATAFPEGAALKTNAQIGRLTVSNAPGNRGDTDGDGDIDQILAYGARSFSILNQSGQIIFDSGSHMEEFFANNGVFNPSSPATSGLFDDTRSDNKGPEPEGITVGQVGDKTLAFVGLERGGGGVMIYDVTDPAQVSFVQYLRNPADVSPEGLTFVDASASPSGRDLLFVTNEVSSSVTLFESGLATNPRVGDLIFVAANSDTPDAFAFLFLADIAAGTAIGFTDRNLSASSFPESGEMAMVWTADKRYEAGTVVTIQTEVSSNVASADKGSLVGRGGGLSASGETIYAFTGQIQNPQDPGTITVDRLLASINIGGAQAGDIPESILATSLSFTQDNVRYSGRLDLDSDDLLASIINTANNWTTDDSNAYLLNNGGFFAV